MKKKLLLQVCCGICTSRIIEQLLPNYDITGYFYNPNIEPPVEYQKRLQVAHRIFDYYNQKLIIGEYENQLWHDVMTGFEHWAEGGPRCERCFELRLEKTVQKAVELKIRLFATTLIVNPYKDKKFIDKSGFHYANLYNLEYIPIKFTNRERYNLTVVKKLDLYRQKYCGCVYSAPI